MDKALFAVELVERYGLTHGDALDCLLEFDMDKAAKKMAQKAAPDDDDKQKELEAKFKKKMKARKESGYFGKKNGNGNGKDKDDED